jgi:type IV pilus assembly protein PilQ
METRDVVAMIARRANQNILVSDQVRGKITVNLKDVPWRDALHIVASSQGLITRESGGILIVDVAH